MLEEGSYASLPSSLLALASRLDSLSSSSASTRVCEAECFSFFHPQQSQPPDPSTVWVENSQDVVLRKRPDGTVRFRCGVAFQENTDLDVIYDTVESRMCQDWLVQGFNTSVVCIGGPETNLSFEEREGVTAKNNGFDGFVLAERLCKSLLSQDKTHKRRVGVASWLVSDEDKVVDLVACVQQGARHEVDLRVARSGTDWKTVAVESDAEVDQVLETLKRWRNARGPGHAFARVYLMDLQANRTCAATIVQLAGKMTMRDHLGRKRRETWDHLTKLQQHNLNMQRLEVNKLVLEISRLEMHRERLSNVPAAKSTVLNQLLAPLIANNHKTFFLPCLVNEVEYLNENQATLRLACSARLINTACIRALDHRNKPKELVGLQGFRCPQDPPTVVPYQSAQHTSDDVSSHEPQDGVIQAPEGEGVLCQSLSELNLDLVESSPPQVDVPKNAEARDARTRMRGRTPLSSRESRTSWMQWIRETGVDPLIVTLKDKLRALQEQDQDATQVFEKEKRRLEEENAQLQSLCEELESETRTAEILRQYEEDRDCARKEKLETEELIRTVQEKIIKHGKQMNYVNFARDRIKQIRKEIADLEVAVAPLRKQKPHFRARSRFVEHLSKAIKEGTTHGLQTLNELEQHRNEASMVSLSAQQLEQEQETLEGVTEELFRIRQDTSDEVVLMRKYLSHVASNEEKRELLQQLEATRSWQSYPVGDGVPREVADLLRRLDSLVNRKAPVLLPNLARVREMVERMGLQLQDAEFRERQMLQGLEDMIKEELETKTKTYEGSKF